MFDIFYNIAQKYKITSTEEQGEISHVDTELYQHGSRSICVQNFKIIYYNASCHTVHVCIIEFELIITELYSVLSSFKHCYPTRMSQFC